MNEKEPLPQTAPVYYDVPTNWKTTLYNAYLLVMFVSCLAVIGVAIFGDNTLVVRAAAILFAETVIWALIRWDVI